MKNVLEEIGKIRWCKPKSLGETVLAVLAIMIVSILYFILCDLGISGLFKLI